MASLRRPESIDKPVFKAKHGFDRRKGQVDYLRGPFDYAVVCAAALCAFCDFRLADFAWRAGRPNRADRYGIRRATASDVVGVQTEDPNRGRGAP